jgi:tRNA threonylcarbamoyladenosine biosynthesis protein TsaE
MQLDFKLSQIEEVAQQLLEGTSPRVWLFHGEMGAGKTTLIKAIAKQLGVAHTTASPTFSLVNEYSSPQGPVYHFDLYRLKNEREAFDFGIEDYLYSGHYCFIEWPDRIPKLLPESYAVLRLSVTNNETRHLEFSNV